MSYLLMQGDACRIPLATKSVDLVFGSPPYIDARLYLENGDDIGIARECVEWVDWMIKVTTEAIRVSRGPVLWVVAGKTEDRHYQPGPEGLVWEWYRRGGCMECPCYWHRVGISGSGGDQWFRKDVEYVLCFKRDPKFPWSDNTAMGGPPKWAPGGKMNHRLSDGRRVDRPGRFTGPPGERGMGGERQYYVPPDIVNPGNLLDVKVGGGHLGHAAAHENEAPYPEDIPEWFIRSFCPPGGACLDPFSGSGTTASVAERLGRIGIGMDLRRSQAEIARRRISRPHARVVRSRQAEPLPLPLFAGLVGDTP